MVRRRTSAKAVLASLNVEMGQPHITASALAAMEKGRRKLVFIDAFHGYACSKCRCRFPESKPQFGKSFSVAHRRRVYSMHRQREFAAHHCA